MNEVPGLALALITGLLLGGVFFGGLWVTVNRGMKSAQPALWFFGSLILRTTLTIGGFFLVCGNDWARWLICLLGFTLARFIVKWWTEARDAEATGGKRKMPHAP